jgi:type IV pilus assembly protein PilY1
VGDKEGNKTIAQSMYGIWDKQTRGETGTNGTVARTTLQAQTMTTGLTGTDGTTNRDARIISNNSVNWFETTNAQGTTVAAQNGWYLNLVQSDGEMVVENMAQLGNTLFAQTLVPNSDPCGTGASNWTYAINPFSGGRTAHNAFDYKATGDDLATDNVSAIKQDGEGGGTLAQNPDGGFQFCTGQECVNIYPDPTSIGRQSWRRVDEQESN